MTAVFIAALKNPAVLASFVDYWHRDMMLCYQDRDAKNFQIH